MGNLSKAAQEIQSLTQRIDAALEGIKSEQIVWIYKVGDTVTTREFGSIQFMVVAHTEVVGIPGYILKPIDSTQNNPKTRYAFGEDFKYPCPENNMRAVQ